MSPHRTNTNKNSENIVTTKAKSSIKKFRFTVNRKRFTAESCIGGVLINPSLPKMFNFTANECRPPSQAKWWHRPFIVTSTVESSDAFYANRTDEYAEAGRQRWNETERANWLKAWPAGACYETRCLDGGAWDRSTSWGSFATLADALACANGRSA